jgi:hypothetical protein
MDADMTSATPGVTGTGHSFFPREHGATAMLLTPFCAAAVLARVVRWQEAAALAAVVCVFMVKDPLVLLARQRWVWKQRHPETPVAMRWIGTALAVIAACGFALLATGPWTKYLLLFGGAAAFSGLAIWVNVHNLQRETAFQVASAVALTSTSLTAALAATDTIPGWCWWLWGLTAAQSVAGIFTVHARLDARVAARKRGTDETSRGLAIFFSALLGVAGIAATAASDFWVGAALLLAAAGYAAELARQRSAAALRMPLTTVGVQMLTMSLVYSAMVVRGLW